MVNDAFEEACFRLRGNVSYPGNTPTCNILLTELNFFKPHEELMMQGRIPNQGKCLRLGGKIKQDTFCEITQDGMINSQDGFTELAVGSAYEKFQLEFLEEFGGRATMAEQNAAFKLDLRKSGVSERKRRVERAFSKVSQPERRHDAYSWLRHEDAKYERKVIGDQTIELYYGTRRGGTILMWENGETTLAHIWPPNDDNTKKKIEEVNFMDWRNAVAEFNNLKTTRDLLDLQGRNA